MTKGQGVSVMDYFQVLENPRIERSKRHQLLDKVAIAIGAVICGADSWGFTWRCKKMGGWTLEPVRRLVEQHTFQVLPRRWVVERTFGWLNLQRRLSKDYEALCETTETWIYISMTRLMLRRLAQQ